MIFAWTTERSQMIRVDQIRKLYGFSTFDLGVYIVRVDETVPTRGGSLRFVRVRELGRILFGGAS